MKNTNQQVRQGDVFIEAITAIPAEAKAKESNIIAIGESMNHAHAMFGKATILEHGDDIYLNVEQESQLRHILMEAGVATEKWTEEHQDITLQPGAYKVTLQRQYDPYAKAVERVLD
jgi:hypothetical protein